ncbi:MAG TPA: RND transporter, partial [Vicinamibacteria bacterium]
MTRWLDGVPWAGVVIACATLGLAPFVPVPHVLEKLQMLGRGQLVRPIDWFDLAMHGSPWAVAAAKAALSRRRPPAA